jgi:hypothetical protein
MPTDEYEYSYRSSIQVSLADDLIKDFIAADCCANAESAIRELSVGWRQWR